MIELPRDAGGREIPLDTEVLYDRYGFKNNVKSFTYFIRDNMWRVRFTISTSNFAVSDMYLTEPDSWKKLEEDLGEAGDARVAMRRGHTTILIATQRTFRSAQTAARR